MVCALQLPFIIPIFESQRRNVSLGGIVLITMQFFYVYVLKSLRDGRWYIGSTQDLKQRLKMHNSGAVKSTRVRRPFQLVFYEAYPDRRDARRREGYFKTSKGKSTLKVMLAQFLKSSFDRLGPQKSKARVPAEGPL